MDGLVGIHAALGAYTALYCHWWRTLYYIATDSKGLQTKNPGLSSGLYDKLWGTWTSTFSLICTMVLPQDAMHGVPLNIRPETLPNSITKVEGLARITIAQWNTVGHKSWFKDQKPIFTTQMCQVWKELDNQPNKNGWIVYKLGLRLSQHTKQGLKQHSAPCSKANMPGWPC